MESVFGIWWPGLSSKLRACFKGARSEVAKIENIKWMDEWKAPLYQAFLAKRR